MFKHPAKVLRIFKTQFVNFKLSKDFRSTVPRLLPENLKANMAFVDLVSAIAQRKNATPAQIALAWIIAQKPWFVPIPGTTKMDRLYENLGAAAVEFTPDELQEINAASSKIVVQGERYSGGSAKMINR